MATINFIPRQTVIPASWLNEVDEAVYGVKSYGAIGDGVTDDTVAIQAALNAGKGPIYFPPGIYVVTSTIVVPDGSGIIGANAFWKRRTGYSYNAQQHTVFKYTGAAGLNTCVIRFSNTAVGTVGTDFTAPGTDDLTDVIGRNFHVDANGRADYGVYVYRAGNQASLDAITCEKAVKANHVHLGCFAAEFGTFGAYESVDTGVICGYDQFGWASSESTNWAYRARFLTANNGTSHTYVAGTGTDLDNSGGKFTLGRGSQVFITSEGNYGRAGVLSQYNMANAAGGPLHFVLEYIEGNNTGFYIDYRNAMDGIKISDGFIHPGNGGTLNPQNFKLEAKTNAGVVTTDEGPTNPQDWILFESLFGNLAGVGFAIDSNTYKYNVVRCDAGITYTTRPPTPLGTFGAGFFRADAGLTDTRYISPGLTLSRPAVGRYLLTFTVAQPDANYTVDCTAIQTTGAALVFVGSKSTTSFELRTVAPGTPGTLADIGSFIDFSVKRVVF